MDILIVDDEMDLCHILSLICLRKQFTVSCAHSLLDAFVQIESLPKLMFLDNNLSDGLGSEMIAQLKLRSPRTKIAFITACDDPKIKNQALTQGVDYFLAKPFHLQGVREILSLMQDKQINKNKSTVTKNFPATPSN
jgi:DNA-binding response OmpR family regulator